jgi:hypothetical protein
VAEPLAAGDYLLTIVTVENPAPSPDRFTNPKAGNRFVKFELTMANRGGLHLPVWASYFTLRDSGGIDNPVRTDVSGDQYLRTRSLPPGGVLTATLIFEMAANQRPEHLVFAPAIVGWRTRISVDLPS